MNHKLIVVSRREWLKRVGAAAALPPRLLIPLVAPNGKQTPVAAQSPSVPVAAATEALTASEAEDLTRLLERTKKSLQVPVGGAQP